MAREDKKDMRQRKKGNDSLKWTGWSARSGRRFHILIQGLQFDLVVTSVKPIQFTPENVPAGYEVTVDPDSSILSISGGEPQQTHTMQFRASKDVKRVQQETRSQGNRLHVEYVRKPEVKVTLLKQEEIQAEGHPVGEEAIAVEDGPADVKEQEELTLSIGQGVEIRSSTLKIRFELRVFSIVSTDYFVFRYIPSAGSRNLLCK